MIRQNIVLWALAAPALCLGLVSPASSQTVANQYDSSGKVPASLEQLRRHGLDDSISGLTYHNMDQLFDTRVVTRSGSIWELPRTDIGEMPTYRFQGSTRTVDEFMDRTYTSALLVIRDGRIVYEKYRNNTSAASHFAGFSMSKSFTSVLVGIALDKGIIRSVDDKAVTYVPELKGTGYDGVTLRQLLQMRSGTLCDERKAQIDLWERVLVTNQIGFNDAVLELKRGNAPGSTFNYCTIDTAVLGWVLERASGQPISKFMSTNLWEPLGAESYGYWLADGPPGVGREINGMGYNATLRDYGRFGLMLLGNGVANGKQVVSADWVRKATEMVPTAGADTKGRTGYGFQFWQMGSAGYAARGFGGQFISVDPSTRSVIVKLSYFPLAASEEPKLETEAFFEAVVASFR